MCLLCLYSTHTITIKCFCPNGATAFNVILLWEIWIFSYLIGNPLFLWLGTTTSFLGATLPDKYFRHEGFPSINIATIRHYRRRGPFLLQHIKSAVLITAEVHRRITKPSLVKDLLFKRSTFKRPQPFKDNPLKDLWLCSQVSAGVLLNCWYCFLQKHKAPQRRKKDSPPSPFTILSPQVTFLCNLSLETITLPRSPDAHQHTEQMRRQSWETGRLQSDTSQVWLCGYVSLSPPSFLSCVKCHWGALWGLRGQGAFPGQREETENNTVVLNNGLGEWRLEVDSLLAWHQTSPVS